MGRLFIEAKPIVVTSGDENIVETALSSHLYSVYQDDSGKESIVRGDPFTDPTNNNLAIFKGELSGSPDDRKDEDGNPISPVRRLGRAVAKPNIQGFV